MNIQTASEEILQGLPRTAFYTLAHLYPDRIAAALLQEWKERENDDLTPAQLWAKNEEEN